MFLGVIGIMFSQERILEVKGFDLSSQLGYYSADLI